MAQLWLEVFSGLSVCVWRSRCTDASIWVPVLLYGMVSSLKDSHRCSSCMAGLQMLNWRCNPRWTLDGSHDDSHRCSPCIVWLQVQSWHCTPRWILHDRLDDDFLCVFFLSSIFDSSRERSSTFRTSLVSGESQERNFDA